MEPKVGSNEKYWIAPLNKENFMKFNLLALLLFILLTGPALMAQEVSPAQVLTIPEPLK